MKELGYQMDEAEAVRVCVRQTRPISGARSLMASWYRA